MRRKLYSTGLYAQMLILFIVLLIPVQVVGAAIHLNNIQALTTQVNDKCERALAGAMDYISGQLSAIRERAYVYLQNSNSNLRQPFRSTVQESPSKRWINIRDIMKELSWMIYSNDIIDEITVFYPTLGFRVNSEAYHKVPSMQLSKSTTVPYANSSEHLSRMGKNLLLTLTLPNESKPINNAVIVMQVSLSMEALTLLADARVFAGKNLVMFKDGYLVGMASGELDEQTIMQDGIEQMKVGQVDYKVLSIFDSIYELTLINLVPTKVFNVSSSTSNILFGGYVLASVSILLAYALIMQHIVYTPIRRLLAGYKEVQQGNAGVHLPSLGPVELRQLIDGFNEMSTHLSAAKQTIYDQQLYAQQIEFKQLQAQINPHFLYNTFFMVERMVDDGDTDAARASCRYLGSYFQYITHPRKQTATLQEEYSHAMNYIMLQKLRYESRIMLEIEPLPDVFSTVEVPRLIFQPILENVFTHGMRSSISTLVVRIGFRVTRALIVVFENSASEPPDEALSLDIDVVGPAEKTSGLKNIHRRIRLMYGSPYGLLLLQSDLGGLRVQMSLPLCPGGDEHATF